MTLKEYLDQNDLSLKAFADQCGLSAPTILRARDGICLPSRRSMLAISRATGGAVTITDLVTVHDEECSEDRS
jgi:transcriptional regulator with XRE-family HTH domain